MSSRGRLIASCLAALAACLLLLGCGSSGPVQVDLPAETVTNIDDKLSQIQDRFDKGRCTGPNSAETSLEALQAAVDGLEGVDQQFLDDMNKLLDNLGELIADQCVPAVPTTDTTDTIPPDTIPTTTDTVPTATETTTSTTTDTTATTTTSTTTDTEPTTGNGGGGNGGAVTPGAGKRKNPAGSPPKPAKPERSAKRGEKERSR